MKHSLIAGCFLLFGIHLFSVGCNKKIPLQQARIRFTPNNNNPDDHVAVSFIDRFGDRDRIRLSKLTQDTIIKAFLPMRVILFGGTQLVSPFYLKPNDDIRIDVTNNGQVFEKNENACSALFELKDGWKLSSSVMDSKIGQDYNFKTYENFHQTGFGYSWMKSKNNLLDKTLSQMQKLDDTCHIPAEDKKIFQSQLEDWNESYLVRDIINAHPDSLKEPHVAEAVNALGNKIFNLYDLKKGLRFNEQELVYGYNLYLSRDALNTPDEFKTLWHNTARFNAQARDFIRFRLLKKYLYRYQPDYEKYRKQFQRTAQDKKYVDYIADLKKNYRTELNDAELSTVMRDTFGNTFTLKKIIADNKNKLIYLSTWNVWGENFNWGEKPEEVANMDAAAKMNALPIFLSTNKDMRLWKMAIDSTPHGIYPTYNMEINSPLFNFINRDGYFNSLIIKNGKVYEYFAPRPDNKKSLLNKLLMIAQGT